MRVASKHLEKTNTNQYILDLSVRFEYLTMMQLRIFALENFFRNFSDFPKSP